MSELLADEGRSWLAPYEWQACLAAVDQASRVNADEFLHDVVQAAMATLHQTQPADDQSFFRVDDLTEEDRRELLVAAGFDVDSPDILDVVTDMPDHTIVSDGSAKRIAEKQALLLGEDEARSLRLFAVTGAIAPDLRAEIAQLAEQAQQVQLDRSDELEPAQRSRRLADLNRLERYVESERVDSRGPVDGWGQLGVPDWAERGPQPLPSTPASSEIEL